MLSYGGNHFTILSVCNFLRKNLKNYFRQSGIIQRVRIKTSPRVYFHVENIYYRFKVVFINKMPLFLLTLVVNKILSMFIWLIDCKFLTKNIQSTQVAGENIKLFKYLKLGMDKYVFHSEFEALDISDEDIVLGYPWMESVCTININCSIPREVIWGT
jgi:hypothetical protein